jgi:hypothetical protein
MPIPKPETNENRQKFVSRCMNSETMKKDHPDSKQRIAICLSQITKPKANLLDRVLEILGFTMDFDCDVCGSVEELTSLNLIIPNYDNYIDAGEETEDHDISYLIASQYQGKKVTLNKPFRTPDGPKKFSVYVKNEKGNVVKVNFGDPERSIKRDSPERRKNFRARHGCDNPGPKYKAKYWSCKFWSNKKVSDLI